MGYELFILETDSNLTKIFVIVINYYLLLYNAYLELVKSIKIINVVLNSD
jgi:hypothetical protein